MSERCTSGEHIDCDGTVKAAAPTWGWDPCTCKCHPAPVKDAPVDMLPEGIIVTPTGKLVVEW